MRVFGFGLLIASTVVGLGLACGAPSSFDNLTGGRTDASVDSGSPESGAPDARTDPTLAPPRPVAPPSVTWVDGSRPHFKWQLPPGAIGAHLELCKTRACTGETQSYEAGTQFDPPDLAPGLWYWRLLSKTADSIGQTYSPVWEVLVRGGPGKATRAGGTMVDLDGDGRMDLIVSLTFLIDAGGPLNDIVGFLATNDDSTAFLSGGPDGEVAPGPASTLANPPIAVVDTDGDGLSDLVAADKANGVEGIHFATYFGTTTGFTQDRVVVLSAPPTSDVPMLREAPDLDGDGWGDVLVSTTKTVWAMYGTARGLGPISFIFSVNEFLPDSGVVVPTSSLPIQSGFDQNGDGLFDFALSWPVPSGPPIYMYNGTPDRFNEGAPRATAPPPLAPPTVFTSGDVDGDGASDLAFATVVGGKPAVCVSRSSDAASAPPLCWSPTPVPVGFASSLTAGDLEPDGKDEILVGSTSGGVDVLRVAAGALVADHITTPFGATLTTILPGRPGPATWAATRADGTAIQIFKGTAPGTPIPPVGATRFAPALR